MKRRSWALMRRSSVGLLAATALSGTVSASSASAAQVIGQTAAPLPPGSANIAVTQFQVAPGGPSYSPSAPGVITSWSAMADASSNRTLMLLVLRPNPGAGPNHYITQQKDQLRTLTMASQLNTFTGVHLPIEPSEQLGLWRGPAPTQGPSLFAAGAADFIRSVSTGDPPLGTSLDYAGGGNNGRVNASAVVEPDCDKDGLGDETQDKIFTNAACPAPVTCKGQFLTMVGTNGPDEIVGTADRDVIAALEGNDKVRGLGDKDLICGGKNKDTLKGGKGKDKLLGQQGKDRLRGGGGRDVCKGGKGDDSAKKCEVEKSI